MCTVCGCGEGETRIEGKAVSKDDHHHDHDHFHSHQHNDGHHRHHHHGDHHHGENGDLHYGAGAAGVSVGGMNQSRLVELETDILIKNNGFADVNRAQFAQKAMFVLNLVSSPGSGKTTLLCRTIELLQNEFPISVIEGDQQTSADADRIRATGAPAIQINTGKGCHLDAHMVGHAVEALSPEDGSLVLVENVGNLVCPAAFDLGEAHKVAILSVTEGEDKPLKYPDMFAASDLVLLNKVDLLPHLDFDIEAAESYIRRVNPKAQVLRVSARTNEGMDAWLTWLRGGMMMVGAGRGSAPPIAEAAE